MGIIDVNLDRPAFKRGTETEESEDVPTSDGDDAAPTTPSRTRTLLKTIGVLAVGFMGMMTVRKFRARRSQAN